MEAKLTHSDISGPREEVLPKSVEARRHDPIRRVECLFHAVPMVYIDIDVQYSRVYPV